MQRTKREASGEPAITKCPRAVFVAVGLACALSTGSAFAQTKGAGATKSAAAAAAPKGAAAAGGSKGAAAKKIDLPAVTAQIEAKETLGLGLAAVEGAGDKAKTLGPRIEELLAKGLTTDLAIAAMRALGAIGAPSSSAVIGPYLQHRSADIRKAAALALARTGGPDAAIALRKGLRSSDAEVRSLAASGLGQAGDEQSVPDLARALERGILEAAPSIGALCAGAQCDDLLSRLEKLPLEKQQATLEAMLHRKPALSNDLLLRAIAKVQLSTGESTKAYFSSLERSYWGTARVKKALDAAAHPPKVAAPAKAPAPAKDPAIPAKDPPSPPTDKAAPTKDGKSPAKGGKP